MRLLYSPLDFIVDLFENECSVVYIENPLTFSSFVGNLWNQTDGKEGVLVLSDNECEMNLTKEACLIINPFDIVTNNKKVINKLYQEVVEVAQEEYIDETNELNHMIVSLLDKMSEKVSYNIDYDLELNLENLLKIYNFRIDSANDTLLDKIIDYIKVMHRVLRVKLIIFVNIKSYLSEEEIEELYKAATYEKIYLLLIENRFVSANLSEKWWIIDKDLCIIKSDELTALRKSDGSAITSFEV